MSTSQLHITTDWGYGQSGTKRHYLVEAWLAGAVVGRAYGWFEPEGQFVMEKIEVEPAHRCKGYGSAVIDVLREQAHACSCREIVFKGVRPDNAGAIRLYESLGAVARPTPDGLLSCVLSPPMPLEPR